MTVTAKPAIDKKEDNGYALLLSVRSTHHHFIVIINEGSRNWCQPQDAKGASCPVKRT